jgi:hypothetical protein
MQNFCMISSVHDCFVFDIILAGNKRREVLTLKLAFNRRPNTAVFRLEDGEIETSGIRSVNNS